MVVDADGCVAVQSLEALLTEGDDGGLVLYARWDVHPVSWLVGVCHQRPDGSYGAPDEFDRVEACPGEEVTWSCGETDVFCAVARTWTGSLGSALVVEVPRRTWTLAPVVDGEAREVEEVLVGSELDLAGLAVRLGIEDRPIVSWKATTPQGETDLGATDRVLDLVPAGSECVLEACFESGGMSVSFLPGCAPEEVEGVMDDIVLSDDQAVLELPDCAYVRCGYSFVGWTTGADGDGAPLPAGAAFDIASCSEGDAPPLVFLAVWEPGQIRVSVPVVACLEPDEAEGTCFSRSVLTLTNDSAAAVELAGIDVVTEGPWHLVAWGSVTDDADVALALETGDGARCDLSSGDATGARVRIGCGSAPVEVAILCETGTGEAQGGLCSLHWRFRATDVDINDGGSH
jgi:hypothetical protein